MSERERAKSWDSKGWGSLREILKFELKKQGQVTGSSESVNTLCLELITRCYTGILRAMIRITRGKNGGLCQNLSRHDITTKFLTAH